MEAETEDDERDAVVAVVRGAIDGAIASLALERGKMPALTPQDSLDSDDIPGLLSEEAPGGEDMGTADERAGNANASLSSLTATFLVRCSCPSVVAPGCSLIFLLLASVTLHCMLQKQQLSIIWRQAGR